MHKRTIKKSHIQSWEWQVPWWCWHATETMTAALTLGNGPDFQARLRGAALRHEA